jgi:diphthamide synthase subunit DPH2
MKKLKKITLKVGKKVSIGTPDGNKLNPHTIHIENIFKATKPSKEGIIIVYRVWSKNRKRWKFFAESFYTLQLWNDHIFNLHIYEKNKKKVSKKQIKKSISARKNKISKALDRTKSQLSNTNRENSKSSKNSDKSKV